MVVKVYGAAYGSTKRVIACFIEKEIEHEVVDIDLFKGENTTPEYLNLQRDDRLSKPSKLITDSKTVAVVEPGRIPRKL
ncbi:UNVERIFIED_CONTAM: hypothetical protein Sradi_5068300 [Sesamum radiatum]|uniref:Glutathione S-transferase n=1 Tax=Sesamum radiatum TaxID=300843 RepID=A0AAW2M0I7_SESRA